MRGADPTVELQALADELAASIEDEAQGRSADNRPFKREVFVELIVADLTTSIGYSDPQLAFHSHLKRTAQFRVDGVSDDGPTLHLFPNTVAPQARSCRRDGSSDGAQRASPLTTSTASASPTTLKPLKGMLLNFGPTFRIEATQSAAVTGLPSWKLRPSRSWNV